VADEAAHQACAACGRPGAEQTAAERRSNAVTVAAAAREMLGRRQRAEERGRGALGTCVRLRSLLRPGLLQSCGVCC